MTITRKSPKLFHFSLISRMQGYCLDVVEDLYYANDIYVRPDSKAGWAQRIAYQRKALSTLKLLSYVSQLAMEQSAIQPKQYEQISALTLDTQNLLGAWALSDRKRFEAAGRKQKT